MLRKIEKSIFLSKPIIGIVTRLENNMHKINKSLIDNITKCGGLCLGIINEERYSYEFLDRDKLIIDNILKICDGFVIPGGSTESYLDKYIIEYATKNNIPILGICLGMQEMSSFLDLEEVSNHNKSNRYVHKVNIDKNSLLYKIFKKDIYVNSRHNYKIKNLNSYKAVGSCLDVIEAIERDDNTFNVGVQWHPEDIDNEELFDYFINSTIFDKNFK